MANYIGAQCPVCSEKFAQGDDIVVCPECGAPYHRACYEKTGHCKFEDRHGTQECWKRPDAATVDGLSQLRCPSCGTANPAEAVFCQICGERLNTPASRNTPAGAVNQGPRPIVRNPYTTPYGGLDARETIAGIPVRDWALFVGNNSYYFLPRFKQMDRHTVSFGANWSSLFFNFLYYFYRKMYLIGAVLLGLWVLTFLPSIGVVAVYMKQLYETGGLAAMSQLDIDHFMAFLQNYQGLLNITSVLRYLSFILSTGCALFANKLYFLHAKKKIQRISEQFPDEQDRAHALAHHGRTNFTLVIVCIAAFLFLLFVLPNVLLMLLTN